MLSYLKRLSSSLVISYIHCSISSIGSETIWPPFAYDILKYDFYENLCNLIEISLKFVHKDPMNNKPAFVKLASMSLNVFCLIYDYK